MNSHELNESTHESSEKLAEADPAEVEGLMGSAEVTVVGTKPGPDCPIG